MPPSVASLLRAKREGEPLPWEAVPRFEDECDIIDACQGVCAEHVVGETGAFIVSVVNALPEIEDLVEAAERAQNDLETAIRVRSFQNTRPFIEDAEETLRMTLSVLRARLEGNKT